MGSLSVNYLIVCHPLCVSAGKCFHLKMFVVKFVVILHSCVSVLEEKVPYQRPNTEEKVEIQAIPTFSLSLKHSLIVKGELATREQLCWC